MSVPWPSISFKFCAEMNSSKNREPPSDASGMFVCYHKTLQREASRRTRTVHSSSKTCSLVWGAVKIKTWWLSLYTRMQHNSNGFSHIQSCRNSKMWALEFHCYPVHTRCVTRDCISTFGYWQPSLIYRNPDVGGFSHYSHNGPRKSRVFWSTISETNIDFRLN